ncbi:hypothetical protein E4188_23960 (plasmid) [Aeromonas media]|uniref:PRTRC system protein E n=3 Tax=Aeromonas TaxID=642 RepID=A0ABX6NYV2_AERME|nr:MULTISPECIES: hypothetical protein [Aeromonas]HDN9374610.1 hypothetical protein [Aeromonas salmonicida]QJT41548.1 hypothetical protein E4188_23960 [Aeromonas media]QLI60279.1 hypothetical protein C1C91_22820 [Aeromonas caviae]HDN9378919.1 hypothetical protein [Aeromonas salmonicida]HDN9389813.1 hypothetical protein [Aeromonas salmonicida]
MFQPLIECLSTRLGVSQFNLQVSGSAELTRVIIIPVLSAPAANVTGAGYQTGNQAYRAALTTPVVVSAPLSDIDTRLAEILDEYARNLSNTLRQPSITEQLQKAVSQAAVKDVEPKKKGGVTKSVADGESPAASGAGAGAGAGAAQEQVEPQALFDKDILSSLGI